MDTEPESSPRNHLAYESKYIQRPNGGRYNLQRSVHDENPRTGDLVKNRKINALYGYLIWIAAIIIIVIGVGNIIGHLAI